MMCFGLKDRKRVKTNHCVIVLLDDTQLVHELHATSTGQDLLDVVIKHLNLLETSYFGLRYLDTARCSSAGSASSASGRFGTASAGSSKDRQQAAASDPSKFRQVWLDVNRSAIKQLRDVQPMTVYFGVKYYASDPCKLAEEITRYQFFLQCKQDILHSRLPVPFDLAVELFALAVQSELGDYDPSRHQEGYVSEFQFLPSHQSHELERRVALFHRSLTGQVPATAELNFLERVKWLDLYGCELHPIQYEEASGEEYALGLNPSGVLVLRNRLKVAHYLWARIVKTKCQGRCFLMDVIDNGKQAAGSGGSAERNRFGFRLVDKAASQRLRWAIEEHKSFYHLIHSSASLSQLAQRQQQQPQQLKLGQRFRHSIRSAISVGQLNNSAAAAAAATGIQQQLAHQQKLRSSMKSAASQQQAAAMQQQYALDVRPPPTVVRMPSRRYSNRSMTRGPYILQQQQQAHTMVDSQRQQALMMMSQFNQMDTMAGKSQTLKPMPTAGACPINSKEAKRNPYYQMLMMMAAGENQPEVAVLPPGRHVVQPSIYKASSVVNGLNQLGSGSGARHQRQPHMMTLPANHQQRLQHGQQLVGPIAMQFFNTAPRPPPQQYYGHESPRSTKSAIAPSSALRLASKKLAKQQQQQLLLYNQQQQQVRAAQPLLAYESQQQQQHHLYGDHYGESQHTYMMGGGGTASANVSPRSVRSARMAGRHKSKSTNENLHLLHSSAAAAGHLLSQSKMLLTTANMMPPPPGYYNDDCSPPPPPAKQRQQRHQQRLYSTDNETGDVSKLSKRNPILLSSTKKRATFALNNDQANLLLNTNGLAVDHQQSSNGNNAHGGLRSSAGKGKDTLVLSDADDDYCCSRSDCSSLEDGAESKENNGGGYNKRSGAQRPAQSQRARKMSSGSTDHKHQLEHIQPGIIRRSQVAAANEQQRQQSDWNAIRRRHDEFSNGKGYLAANAGYTGATLSGANANQRQQVPGNNQVYSDGDQGDEFNNNNNNAGNGNSQVVKHIANKQATPILLSMNYEQENNANNKAVQLLNLQRQQLHSQSSQSSDAGCGTKSSSSAADSAPSSVASSPQAANTGAGQRTQAPNQQSSTVGKMGAKLATTADSTTSSSTTSGYYAGSVNSTGSASVDSEGSQGVDGPTSHHLSLSKQAPSGGAKQVTIRANSYQPYSSSSSSSSNNNNNNSDWQQQQEGTRAKIALGSYGARISGTRLLIGNKAQFNQKSNNNQVTSLEQQPLRSQQKQQFYLGEANNNQEDDADQLVDGEHVIGNEKASNIGQQQQSWLPMSQIQTQNAPSSLKYVSFDV